MGRRVRHLNPVHLGASCSLDARFIEGVADTATIQDWNSRAGGTINFSQATSARRPAYRTNIQSGQPVVRFTGTSQHWMGASALPISSTTRRCAVLAMTTSNVGYIYSQTSNAAFIGAANLGSAFTFILENKRFNIVNTALVQYGTGPGGANAAFAFAGGRDDGDNVIKYTPSRGTVTTTTTGTTADLATNRNATTPDSYGNTDLCALAILPVDTNQTTIRKMLDCFIYSFGFNTP